MQSAAGSDYARLDADKGGGDAAAPPDTLQVSVEDEQETKTAHCRRPWWLSATVCLIVGMMALFGCVLLLHASRNEHRGASVIDSAAVESGLGDEEALKERAGRGGQFQGKFMLIDSLMGKSSTTKEGGGGTADEEEKQKSKKGGDDAEATDDEDALSTEKEAEKKEKKEKKEPEPRCVGFDERACPPYPEPYASGEWPSEYTYSGEFPKEFVWGMGTAAYQVEGAYKEDGRGASIWDTFTGADTVGMPGADCKYCCTEAPCPVHESMVDKGATGDIASDHYHNWRADITLMRAMGLKHYHFSISWPRLIPTGKLADGVNPKAKRFYNDLIDELLAAGIEPYVTLYHFDLPQGLLDPPRMQGWWGRDKDGEPNCDILPHWIAYANTCFKEFGDRVKTWITFHEPWTFTYLASGHGKAPSVAEFANMSLDPLIAGHNVLNAHATAVALYRRQFQEEQGGKIGIINHAEWREPRSDDPEDVGAAERSMQFHLGWFADPIFGGKGDYPPAMRQLLGARLPEFSPMQQKLINGSADFFGLSHNGTLWVSNSHEEGPEGAFAACSEEGDAPAGSAWGIRKVLNWVKRRYNDPSTLVTGGWSATAAEDVTDTPRVSYYARYAAEMFRAIHEDGVRVLGHFAWSFLDGFEWEHGYKNGSGLALGHFGKGGGRRPTRGSQVRRRKDSSCWFEAVWRSNALVDPGESRGCGGTFVLNASFTDPEHLAMVWVVSVNDDGVTGTIVGTHPTGGDTWGPHPANFSGGGVVADFTSSDGPSAAVGYWSNATQTIVWSHNKTWTLVGVKMDVPVKIESAGDSDACPAFKKCPEYPLPYRFGAWPTAYDFSGGFPEGFIWGLGTAAYQIEGAYREGGRGATIWDTFTGADTTGMPGSNCSYCCEEPPCPISPVMFAKGATGNVACDHYHMWRTDIALMKSMGLKHYRFSIAWSRIIPTGFIADGVNPEGTKFYSDLIDALVAEGIEPLVSLYHWDLPQGLFDPPEWQGWWSRSDETGEPDGQILVEWLAYADVCFKAFGDRVKTWITFNEPWTFTFLTSGYGKAPSHPDFSDMSKDPWIAGHNVLNAHAAAVDLYRRKYQKEQGGKIGITNNCDWREPKSADPADVAAAERANLFQLGWYSEPIFGGHGDYPPEMREIYGDRLPRFTEEQRRLLNGSADFFGLNHYGCGWCTSTPDTPGADYTYSKGEWHGIVRGQSKWLYGAGWGFRKILNWVNNRYHRPAIYVTEGGWSLEAHTPGEGADDPERIAYYANYTSEMRKAIYEDGVDVRAYFAWSLLDNFEWDQGYAERFGTTYTDYDFGSDPDGPTDSEEQPRPGKQLRRRKDSNCWLEAVWRSNALVDPHGDDFQGCVHGSVFTGNYTDSKKSGCARSIVVDREGTKAHITGTEAAHGHDCDGKATPWGPIVAKISGGSIIMDMSSFGGLDHHAGFWNAADAVINWADGSSWHARRHRDTVIVRM